MVNAVLLTGLLIGPYEFELRRGTCADVIFLVAWIEA